MGLSITLAYKIESHGDIEPDEEWIPISSIIWSADCMNSSITHNLGQMAAKAKLYEAIWRPYLLFNIAEKDEPDACILAKDITEYLEKGLQVLKTDKVNLLQYTPSNNWGSYDSLLKFTEQYIECTKQFPNARIQVSR